MLCVFSCATPALSAEVIVSPVCLGCFASFFFPRRMLLSPFTSRDSIEVDFCRLFGVLLLLSSFPAPATALLVIEGTGAGDAQSGRTGTATRCCCLLPQISTPSLLLLLLAWWLALLSMFKDALGEGRVLGGLRL